MSKIRSLLHMEPEPAGKPVPRTVFMSGCMRSGTSFLVGKLTQHPQLLQVGSELNDVWTRLGGAPCTEQCLYRDERHFDVHAAQNMGAYFARYVQQSQQLQRAAMRWRHKQRTGSGRVAYDWDQVICLNKSTHLTNKIRYVKSLFPDSKWIVLIRSILGNSASTKIFFNRLKAEREIHFTMPDDTTACWSTSQSAQVVGRDVEADDFRSIPRMWLRLNEQLFRDLAHIPAKDVVVVPYERLVKAQASEMQAIFSKLDLSEAHRGEADRISHTQMQAVNTSTSGNPLTKWRKHLTPDELDIIAEEVSIARDQFDTINARLETITTQQGNPYSYQDPVREIQQARQ